MAATALYSTRAGEQGINEPGVERVRAGLLQGNRLVLTGLFYLALICATGIPAGRIFQQPTLTKYAATIAAPALLAIVLCSKRRAEILLGAVLLVAPFEFALTVESTTVTVLGVLLPIAVVVEACRAHAPVAHAPSRSAWAARWFVLLLLLPLAAAASTSHWVSVIALGMAAGWLTSRIARRAGGWLAVASVFVVSMTFQAVLALYESQTGHTLNLYGGATSGGYSDAYFFNFEHLNRPAGAFPDPISLGNMLAVGLVLAVGLAAQPRRAALARLGLAGSGVLMLVALVLTLSRFSWIGAAAGVIICLALMPGRAAVATTLAVAAVTAVSLLAALAFGGSAIQDRFSSIASPTNSNNTTAQGDRTRLEIWSAAWDTAKAHPWDGIGLGNLYDEAFSHSVPDSSPATHAHDLFLQAAAEGGVLGEGAVAVLLGAVALDAWSGRRDWRVESATLLGAVAAFVLCSVTDFSLRQPSVAVLFGCVCGLAAAISHRPSLVKLQA